ncbi:MAG: FAD-dependent oxidoreductase [Sphaerochaetaceae bacterium]|nr:FAD-dependent oxidoreductase [Spirochaetales bacterium]MDY5499364.1 FAD-dependent oxidoreductase [Sphaerochaetaceae bacterium]
MEITETRATPLAGNYDLIVAGAGVAGICAAVSAKRLGVRRVLLLERRVLFGGLATSGLVGYYEPLDDGKGNRIMAGMSQELAELAMKWGYQALDERWRGFPLHGPEGIRTKFHFSPNIFALALNDLLDKAGVETLMEALVVDARKSKDGTTVMVETRDGRRAYLGAVAIDTTGDGILLDRLGIPTKTGQNWFTYMSYLSSLDYARQAVAEGSVGHLNQWINVGSNLFGTNQPAGLSQSTGTTCEEVTFLIREGQRRLLQKLAETEGNDRDITALPTMPQFRETRRIDGKRTLTGKDACKHQEDTIGLCPDFIHPGPWYEIPFGTLYNQADDRVLTAGRSISANGWAWEVTREIPVAALTGQAAATAAKLMLEGACGAAAINLHALQESLQ